jgi:ribonuclease HII
MANPLWTHDRKAAKGLPGIVGVDEAGRGCLAGPVVAGATLLPAGFFSKATNRRKCAEVNDSKQLDQAKREKLYGILESLMEAGELWFATGEASVAEIERENIVGGTCLAMGRAMDALTELCGGLWKPRGKDDLAEGLFATEEGASEPPWLVLVDGRPMKRLPYLHEGLVKGDTLSLSVAMASIAAKVTRDRLMARMAERYPEYDFASNKGYGAPKHLRALRELGPTPDHRPRFLRKILGEPEDLPENPPQTLLSFD